MQYNGNYGKILTDYSREDILCSLYPVMLPVKTAPAFMVKNYETGLEDIEIIYHVKAGEELLPVTRYLCEQYGIEPIDLIRSVNESSYEIHMKHISKLHDIPEEIMDIYALTNRDSHYGAGLLITDSGRQTVCDIFKRSAVYIFPASVHEMILIPARCLETEHRLPRFKKSLKDIAWALEDIDKKLVLSKHVYRFNPERMTFRTVL